MSSGSDHFVRLALDDGFEEVYIGFRPTDARELANAIEVRHFVAAPLAVIEISNV